MKRGQKQASGSAKEVVVIGGAGSLIGHRLIDCAHSRGFATIGIARQRLIGVRPSHSLTADLSDDKCVAVIRELGSRYRRVHAVNCAGFFPGFVRMHAADLQSLRKCIDDNVLTTFVLAQAVVPLMRRSGGGSFIAMSSHLLDEACPYIGLWNCAKAAVEMLVRTLSNEYLGDGVIANVLRLATVDTPSERALKPGGDFRRWLKPQEVAVFCMRLVEMREGGPRASTLHLFESSKTFYGKSYLERNSLPPMR